MKLTDDDRKAVDLLLDKSADAGQSTQTTFAAPGSDSVRSRVQEADRILSLLNELPLTEPSPDLVARTLRFIEQADARLDAGAYNAPFLSAAIGPSTLA